MGAVIVKAQLSYLTLWSLLLLAPLSCYADLDDESYGAETQVDPQDTARLKLTAVTDVVSRARVTWHHGSKHYLNYASSNVNLDVGFYSQPAHREGAYLSAGLTRTKLHWKHNPFFRQHFFDTATLALNAYSARCYGWVWLARAAINISTDHFDFNHYANYDMLLWGTSTLEQWPSGHIHVGLLIQTGMKIDHVYPILGVDWQVTENFKLNLIFPINISAIYTVADGWTLGVNGRFILTRYRLNQSHFNNFYSRGLVEYRNAGLEGALSYQKNAIIANIHAGYMFGGRLKIANRHFRHSHWFDIGSSPYGGAEVALKF